MVAIYYDILMKWTEQDWELILYSKINNEVSKALSSIGHGDTPLGDAMFNIWEWFDEISGGIGLGMSQKEMQSELKRMLKDEKSFPLKEVRVEIQTEPELNVTILNLEELKKTADPDHEKKARKLFDEMFSAFSDVPDE
ncbi:MAG: hypothetical protein KAQ65_04290 [Candidatus Thorarchaeota archaeon]|nr:hypothetical protein [Candidatus Thorarchaeota archaeon]